MKRELKFRAWDEKSMNYFNNPKDGLLYCSEEIILSSGYNSHDEPTFRGDPPCDIMQFTGLTDKNGDNSKEVYGGDILYNSDREEYQEVIYNEERARWDVRYSHGEQRSLWMAIGNLNTVVGNKFENPELLNQ